ncbi:MAG: hypothetical protein PWP23_2889 [Candidatus Sumerlaeota bacterium]|nr:hypothetical protein [Candidatus Sumerlaeota bacterium]
MRPHLTVLRTAFLLLVLALAVTACKGQRAKVSLQKTQGVLAEVEGLNGATHAPQDVEELRKQVDQANSLLASDPAEAFNIAKEAKNRADLLLQEVEAAESRALWNKAEEDIAVAETNALNRLDPTRYSRIVELRTEATGYRENNQYRDVIATCREISQEVETGISPLRNDAEKEKISAQGKLQDLKSVGGNEYDPESVINVQDTINRATQKMEEDRDYVLARTLFSTAVRQADDGISNVQRAQGAEAIDEIETLLAVSLEEGAKEFSPDEYETVIGLLEKVVAGFEEELYKKTLDATRDLKPRAEALKINTKRKASDARIHEMKTDIDQLVDGGAREYLPGRVEVLDQKLAEARTVREENTEPAFDRVKEIFQEHKDEVSLIDRQFGTLANDAIRLASNQVDTTEQVFLQVAEIFDPIVGTVPKEMEPFEQAKEARRIQLGNEIAAARTELDEAQRRVQDRQYRQAILLAQDQSDVANNLLSDIYRLVSGNAVIELSNLISRYERDGARIYSPDELSRSTEDLQRVKEAINRQEYLLATELSGAARANIELMARRIAGRAVEDIREARQVQSEVSSEKTRKYASKELVEVAALIEEAEKELQAQRLKLAVETANRAIELARSAQQKSNRLAAEDALKTAEDKLERAQKAGANLYAGRKMEDARKLYGSARALIAGGDFVKAEELAVSTAELSDQAFYAKINAAETAIADAKAVGGWDYNNKDLSQASAFVREAREALEAGNYDESAKLADRALSGASSVARSTKKYNFAEARDRIIENLETGRQQGVNYFQVQDSIEIRQKLSELENEWSLGRYDYVMAEMMKLEGRLRETLDTTSDVVQTVARQQTQRLDSYVEAGAVDFAADLVQRSRDNLKFAVLDYRKGQYKSAHSALERAISDINEIESRLNQEAYFAQVRDIFVEFSDAQHQFRNVLALDPAELKALAFGSSATRSAMVAISGESTPADFREDVERLYSRGLLITPPPGLQKVHESVIMALNEGRLAAFHFEKLIILNEMTPTEAERLIDAAYTKINTSNRMIADIQRQFFSEETRVRIVSAEALSGGVK